MESKESMAFMASTSMRDMSRFCQGFMSRSNASAFAGIIPHMENVIKRQILERVDERLRDLDIKDSAASLAAGGKDLIRDWRRKPALPRLDYLVKLAPILKTSPEWLAFGAGPKDAREAARIHEVRSVPLISWVAASRFTEIAPVLDTEDSPQIVAGDLPPGRYFALNVDGDSMDLIAPDRSRVIVNASEQDLLPRRFYIFESDEGVTFKRYMVDPPRLDPYSSNRQHESLPVNESTRVIGRVVRVLVEA